jgi:hypothetical protein
MADNDWLNQYPVAEGDQSWLNDYPVAEQPPGEEFGPRTGETGRLSDPERDRAAWIEARRRDAIKQRGLLPGLSNFNERISEGMLFNIDRPMSGAMSWLSGDGYEYGKAVDAYADEMRDERMGIGGGATELVGGVLSPGAIVKGAGLAKTALISALEGAGGAVLEGENLATEGDQRTWTDRGVDAAVGGTVSGVLSGAGRAMVTDATTAPQSQRQLRREITNVLAGESVPDVETSGLRFRDALRQEQIDLRKSGSSAMREATRNDVTFTGRPDYTAVRTGPNAQMIPITPEGTPSAFALKSQVDALGDNMTLAQIDELRTQARGLRVNAANATDKAAVDDIVRSLDTHMRTNMSPASAAAGGADIVAQYNAGREQFERAARLGGTKGLRAVLSDDTIPGKSIADSLLDMNSSSKSKSPSKIIAVVRETLGEDSQTLAEARRGVLSKLLTGVPDSPAAQEKLLTTLNSNQQLIDDLFTEEQKHLLAKITVALEASKGSRAGDAAYVNATNIIGNVIRKMGPVGRAGGAALGAGLGTGSVGLGIGAGIGSLAADALSSVPARRAALAAGRFLGPGIEESATAWGRFAANPRGTLIDELGAQ